jgi:copper chaperone CopZ
VVKVDVSFEEHTAVVTFDDAQTDVATLTAATAGNGYPSHLAEASGG